MSIKQISGDISYIEASDNPLSANIGIIKSANGTWLYDVGNDISAISTLTGRYNAVLSHFHLDHVGSLEHLNIGKLYVSKFTYEHVGKGIVVDNDLYIDDLHIFPLPSSHAKGCLGLEVGGEYAFIGDAVYSKSNADYYIYNAQLLKAEIETLKRLKAKNILVSHRSGMLVGKDAVIKQLNDIYSARDSASSEIYVRKS